MPTYFIDGLQAIGLLKISETNFNLQLDSNGICSVAHVPQLLAEQSLFRSNFETLKQMIENMEQQVQKLEPHGMTSFDAFTFTYSYLGLDVLEGLILTMGSLYAGFRADGCNRLYTEYCL